ncbi:MAG: DUF6273 domain-containing protein [Treponema sp.]|nr:DUF6273 domain-containing protein [Treponema sp.]
MERVQIAGLKLGEKISFGRTNGGPLVWRIAEQNHKGFPVDAVTIVTDRTIGNITFAPANPLDMDHDRRLYGSNRYKDSYVRHYMNSDEFIKAVFSADEAEAIIATELKIKQPGIDGGGIDVIRDRLFLLSASEAGHTEEDEEGSILELFKDSENLRALDIDGDPDWWLLRTPYASNSCHVRLVYTSGTLLDNDAYYGYFGLRPACNLPSGLLVSRV